MKLAQSMLCIAFAALVCSCTNYPNPVDPDPDPDDTNDDATEVVIEYEEDETDIANPDRGFYRYSETRASNYTPLNEEELRGYRTPGTVFGANYTTVSTLVFRYFILDGLNDKPLPEEYLEKVAADFDIARKAGVKLIPRFTYTVTANSGDCPAGFICPPYGDAPKDIVLGHISQLGPILTDNADVVSVVQMGFIGTWGENYYTDYFGDASVNDDQGKLLDNNWQDRNEVLGALLKATPDDMMIQARYPQLKQRYVYGINAPTTSAPLTESEAFNGSDKARIALHNDCLFASADDFGTYADYGNSSSSATSDVANLKPYFEQDSKYVIVGGETCFDGYSPENDCAPAGMADTDLRKLHYTYLNSAYNNDVNNDWVDGGCMEDIKKDLGYRFILNQGVYADSATKGGTLKVAIDLRNDGYAASMHEREVSLILRSNDGAITKLPFDTDTRFWFSQVSLEQTFTLPESLEGDYEVLLQIADGNQTLADRPEYSIRLANLDTWEASTGFNDLNYDLTIK